MGTPQRRALTALAAAMLAVTALGIAVGYGAWHTTPFQSLELSTVDGRFQVRGTQPAWPGIAVVGIDATALEDYGSFPFDRHLDARMIDRLRADGVRTIAFDLVFDHPSASPSADLALLQAAARARGRLVLAANATDRHGGTNVLGGIANQRAAGFLVGSVNFPVAVDGAVRRVPAMIEGLQSFAVASARSAGLSPARVRALFDGNSQWIDPHGAAGNVPVYSFADVLAGKVPARALRGRIVVIGATDGDLQDAHSVSGWSPPMSGPELEADSIATLMTGAPLRSLPSPLEWLELVLAALALPLLAIARMRWPWLIAAGVLVAASVLVSAQLAFNNGIVTLVVAPLLALLVSATGAVLIPLVIERRELRTLRERFARFDPVIVDAVLASPGVALRVRAMSIGPESVIAGYRLVSLLGRGGMGVVYESEQLTLERPVALKLIDPAHADDDEFRARFVRESHIAAALEHPHVIPVYEAREDDGLLFIAMRLVRGPSLADVFAAAAPLDPARAARLVAQIASALGAAHARGLVHRDVKPANVLLHEGDHAYLTDFGVTRELGDESQLTAVGERIGTVDYMAPEQCRGEAVAPAADIYALGCMLYEALTGAVPFPGESEAARIAAHLREPAPVASQRWPSVPSALDAVILTALAKEPGKRFLSAELFAAAVLRGAGIEPAEPAARTQPPPARGPVRPDQATLASP